MHEGKTPLDLALEREAAGEIDYCDECEYLVVVRGTAYCGVCGKLLLPMMFERGQGYGPARRCQERKEAKRMGLTGADLARLGPAAQKQVLEKLGQQTQARKGDPGAAGRAGERTSKGAERGIPAGCSEMERTLRGRKYHNEPVMVNGIHFDSKKEANRFMVLMSMQSRGLIRGLKLQAQYTLQESYITDTGERVRAIRYVADFAYERATEPDCTGTVHWLPVVEDVKSRATRTAKYEMKKKLLRERFGLAITEV